MKKIILLVSICICMILATLDLYNDLSKEESILNYQLYTEPKRKDGEYKEYYRNGNLAVESCYRNGMLHGVSKF